MCNYNSSSNRLSREVGFQIKTEEMLMLDARVLTQPLIQTGSHCEANVRNGRISLNGHLFTPEPISDLAITYFGTTDIKSVEILMKRFRRSLLHVSFPCQIR